jgi:hypothetical protein
MLRAEFERRKDGVAQAGTQKRSWLRWQDRRVPRFVLICSLKPPMDSKQLAITEIPHQINFAIIFIQTM